MQPPGSVAAVGHVSLPGKQTLESAHHWQSYCPQHPVYVVASQVTVLPAASATPSSNADQSHTIDIMIIDIDIDILVLYLKIDTYLPVQAGLW